MFNLHNTHYIDCAGVNMCVVNCHFVIIKNISFSSFKILARKITRVTHQCKLKTLEKP